MKKAKTVGILGGMGPYATLFFYQSMLQLTPAKKDWEHLRVIIDVNPQIPSRSRHHLYGEASPVPQMIESCRRLAEYPVDFIVIPCNGASSFLGELQPHVKAPILSLMEITVAAVAERIAGPAKVAVLGTALTYDRRTYEPFLQAKGFEYAHHSAASQKRVERLIEEIKINAGREQIQSGFKELLAAIRQEQAMDAVILGCTEFGCLGDTGFPVPVVDSSRELARFAVRLARDCGDAPGASGGAGAAGNSH